MAHPSFHNNTPLAIANPVTSLDSPQKPNFLRQSITGQNCSSQFWSHPLLFLSQPDGNNTWTLSLDSTTISESSLESKSRSLLSSPVSNYSEAITVTRDTLPSISSMSTSFLSLPPSPVDIVESSVASDASMIVSSMSNAQRPHGEGWIVVADSYHDLSHDFPRSTAKDSVLQLSRSKKLAKKSKDIFGRLKRLFTPKETRSEDIQAYTAPPSNLNSNERADRASRRRFLPSPRPWLSYQRYRLSRSTKSTTTSWQGFSSGHGGHTDNHVDERYTYEYHARPKTLKEIKSQRRFSLPMTFVGTPSRATSMKRNVTPSAPRSQSRPMSMYNAPQSGTLNF